MPTYTPNYNLALYDNGVTDENTTFLNYRLDISGPIASNMTKIEAALTNQQDQIDILNLKSNFYNVVASFNTSDATTLYYLGTIIDMDNLQAGNILVASGIGDLTDQTHSRIKININGLGSYLFERLRKILNNSQTAAETI